MDTVNGLISFIARATSAYRTVDTVKERLTAAGYTEVREDAASAPDGKHFFVRNGTSLIAYRKEAGDRGFMVCASHTDQPSFRLKPTAKTSAGALVAEVERYGGMIYYTWFDRPLSVSGRVCVRTGDGIAWRTIDIDRDLFVIPSVAVHMNRKVNETATFNPAVDLLPLAGIGKSAEDLDALIAGAAGVKAEDVISHDLFLYLREEGRRVGVDGEILLCPRLDDLGCVYASLEGFLSAKASGAIPVLALFDNEEVGSETKQGAASTFLYDCLYRIAGDEAAYREHLYHGCMVSADNAHAEHPNHPELCDRDNAPVMGGGVVIKYNANQRYTTDALSAAIFGEICRRAGVPTQRYYNRADLPGGSTLGAIADTKVALPTVDIGMPQLAMHACCECMGAADVGATVDALRAFYNCALHREGDALTIR